LNLARFSKAAVSLTAVLYGVASFPENAYAAGGILSVATGHSILIQASGVTRLAVGDSRVAGVVPIGHSSVLINGKTAGHTTVFIWEGTQEQVYEVTITEQDLDQLANIVRAAIQEPHVIVESVGNNVFVRGNVTDVNAYNHINDVIAQFKGMKFTAGGPDAQVINAVSVVAPLGGLQAQIAKLSPGQGVSADLDNAGNVVVSGSVRDTQQEQQVMDQVRELSGKYLRNDGKVIDRLGVQTSSQVDIKVYVLEVDKTAQSQLGLRLQSAIPSTINSPPLGPYTLSGSSGTSITALENATHLGNFGLLTLLAPTLDLLETNGDAKVLSSPNLVTQSGQAATFLVGGEIPIPVSSGLGSVSIDYKTYGVQLNVTPTIMGDGGVETKISPEISNLDFADGITLNGFVVPALKVSKLSTDVVTQTGESIIMGGLVSRVESKNITKFPILGDLPILGPLFRSTNYQLSKTDVVFVMTPTIVTK
jgi:Flp pilus assembly secretin CpaC